jgi:hypothetical protein
VVFGTPGDLLKMGFVVERRLEFPQHRPVESALSQAKGASALGRGWPPARPPVT